MIYEFMLGEADKWDAIVRSMPNHDVYYLSSYVRPFQHHGDGIPRLLYYVQGDARAINVVMKRDVAEGHRACHAIAKGRYYDFATPYGYGGWLAEGNLNQAVMRDEYLSWCRERNVVSEFVRFHPMLGNHCDFAGLYEVIPLGETVSVDLADAETIWRNLTCKNRNMIRKAQKSGLEVRHGWSRELLEAFRGVYSNTMDAVHADPYYYFSEEFFHLMADGQGGDADLFYAVKGDKMVAASVLLKVNGYLNYHLSGSVREYRHLAPTNLILYDAAVWGSDNGYRTLYLGGGVGSSEDSLFAFKKSFMRNSLGRRRYHIGRGVFMPDEYAEFVDTGGV